MIRYCLLTVMTLFLATAAKAQAITDPELAGLIKKQNSFFNTLVPEKVYLQTDKASYISGDTIRLKAYLLDADYLTPTTRSGLLYIELNNPEGKVVKRLMLPVGKGQASADIELNDDDVPFGSYV